MADSALTAGNQYAGGLSFSSPAFVLGAPNGTVINGGFNFDLPLATIAAFNNQALSFTQANTKAAFGFTKGAISQATSGVNQTVAGAQNFINNSLGTLSYINEFNQSSLNFRSAIAPKASSGGGCFITTAVCESEGLADDCETLTILRKFRDEYMLRNPSLARFVKTYYQIAPGIVEHLDSLADGKREYAYFILRTIYIDTAIARIKLGDFEGAMIVYTRMVNAAYRLAHGD